ncbi:hypothetical protein CDAR_486031 [Caerostris darwini]|uniref:Secreted protein n=1 Tax=Caerostris darwini TaxID=1538125 RepID=A0AAV4WKE4_9ARAC|nr:hypothetical protein CDAR_486031 [Caerostris darwini]
MKKREKMFLKRIVTLGIIFCVISSELCEECDSNAALPPSSHASELNKRRVIAFALLPSGGWRRPHSPFPSPGPSFSHSLRGKSLFSLPIHSAVVMSDDAHISTHH